MGWSAGSLLLFLKRSKYLSRAALISRPRCREVMSPSPRLRRRTDNGRSVAPTAHTPFVLPTLSALPMQLRVGDRFIDNDEEWEVVEAPSTRTGGKAVWTRIHRPGRPETERPNDR